jgi:threonine synthase
MGVPIAKLVVATNANDIMHRFIASGDYSTAHVAPTLAPSMDIQLASNLERYWWHVSGGDGAAVARWVGETTTGDRKLASFPPSLQAALRADFASASADDTVINATIARYLTRDASTGAVTGGYALCPHTACGVHAAEQLQQQQAASAVSTAGSDAAAASAAPAIIVLATAHPAKFAADTPALAGLYGEVFTGADDGRLAALAVVATPAAVSPPLPPQLRGLAAAPRSVTTVAPDAAAVKAVVDAVTGRRA